MRSFAPFLLVLTGCVPDVTIEIDGRGDPGAGTYDTGIVAEVFWDLPYDADEGWFAYHIDELCGYNCSGSEAWYPGDRISGIEITVHNAPYEANIVLDGTYFDGWYWVTVCDDPPQFYVDGHYIEPVGAEEWYDDWGNYQCSLHYGYTYYADQGYAYGDGGGDTYYY